MDKGRNNQVDELTKRFRNMASDQVKIQTAWATVKEIDWEDGSMIATGVSDGVDYFDVSLGLGQVKVKPAIGSMCLIGMIENQDAAAFLIDTENAEDVECKVSGKVSLSNDQESFADLVEDLFDLIDKMVFTTNNGPTIKLVNAPAFKELKTRFNKLLK